MFLKAIDIDGISFIGKYQVPIRVVITHDTSTVEAVLETGERAYCRE